MSVFNSTQVSFHRPYKIFTQTRKSFDLLANRHSFGSPHIPSLSDFINVRYQDLQKMDGIQIKRLQAQAQIKRRYQKMIQLQHRSFIERHDLEAEREQQVKKEQEKTDSKAKQLRNQKMRLGLSTKQWHFHNRLEGAQLRHQRVINHRFRAERESSELQRKKQVVSQHQRSFRLRRNRHGQSVLGQGGKLEEQDWTQF